MLGDLDEGGRGPDEGEEDGGDYEVLPIAEVETGGTGSGFEEHEGRNHEGDLAHVAGVVVVEGLSFEPGQEGINGNLHHPDNAGHGGAGDELDGEKGVKHCQGSYSIDSIMTPPVDLAWALDGEASGCQGPMFSSKDRSMIASVVSVARVISGPV